MAGYIGNYPTAVPLTGADLTDGIITVNKLASTLDLSSKTITLPSGVGGKVLQVVNATYNTEAQSSSSTFSDTGLSASITPSSTSNKILIILHQNGVGKEQNDTYVKIKLLRDSTDLIDVENVAFYTGNTSQIRGSGTGTAYLDSPSTTSSVTYKTQFASGSNNQWATTQYNNSTSTICLMEIAV